MGSGIEIPLPQQIGAAEQHAPVTILMICVISPAAFMSEGAMHPTRQTQWLPAFLGPVQQ